MFQVNDVLQSLQEPHIDFRKLLDALHRVAFLQRLCNGKDAQVGRILKGILDVVELRVVVAHESVHALANHAETLLDHLLERAAYRHDLAHRFHRRADESAYAREFRQVPARNLTDHIVEARGHVCRIRSSHLADLVERVAQRNLGGHEGQRVARCLAGKCRRAAQSGIDFNDAIVVGRGVEGKLNVALAYDAQVAHAADGDFLKLLHLLGSQRTSGSHHDRLTRMDAQRVEVLHRSHREAMVVGVADALKLNLLPSLQRLLNKNLRGKRKGTLGQLNKRLLVGADTRAQTA